MTDKIVYSVNGMKCGGCEANVTKQLQAMAGVESVKAEHKESRVTVEFDAIETTKEAIAERIVAAGYKVV